MPAAVGLRDRGSVRGVGSTLGAAAAFGAVSVLARRAYEAGAEPLSLLGARVLVAAAILAGIALAKGDDGSSRRGAGAARGRVAPPSGLRSRPLAPSVIAGAAFAGAGLAEFQALSRAPAATVVLLVFVAPVWIALAGWLLHRERLGWPRAACLAGLVSGLGLLVAAPDAPRMDPAAAALALGASAMSAIFFVALAAAGERAHPPITACVVATAASAVAVPLDPSGVADELVRPDRAGNALAIGTLTGLALILLDSGVRDASALTASAVICAEPVAAAALSWLLLDEGLTVVQVAGAACVMLFATALPALSRRAPPEHAATGRTRRLRPGSRPPPRPARTARRPR
jgi:drug/metabolite transporter (DMT)-like permease